jgi:crotonobetainyl-CoA:carnitine CoA-transferase CaiB-like acyl-CoA transferase
LLDNDVPSAPVLSRFELLQDVQVRQSKILEEYQTPGLGKVRLPRPAARFDRTPAAIRKLAPALGADNAAILGELGYSADEIARLQTSQVLWPQTPPM